MSALGGALSLMLGISLTSSLEIFFIIAKVVRSIMVTKKV